jgi:uncharacterized membrane protein YGL010W
MRDTKTDHDAPPTPDDARWAKGLEWPAPRRWSLRVQRERSHEKLLYSVPRQFDIATLLVVSLAYSLFFTFLRVLDAPWPVYAFFGLLTVVVAIAQTLFPFGNEPRWASMCAGVVYCWVWCLIGGVAAGNLFIALWGLFCSVVVGPAFGYLVGAIEAGVFLVADKVRQRWFPDRKADYDTSSDFGAP